MLRFARLETNHRRIYASRSQKRSTALVTNVDFDKWGEYLVDGPLAMALLDRLAARHLAPAISHRFGLVQPPTLSKGRSIIDGAIDMGSRADALRLPPRLCTPLSWQYAGAASLDERISVEQSYRRCRPKTIRFLQRHLDDDLVQAPGCQMPTPPRANRRGRCRPLAVPYPAGSPVRLTGAT